MKKLRMVILSFSAFSLFYSIFFNLVCLSVNNKYGNNNDFINDICRPIASNVFVLLVMFAIILIWYIYHKKDRPESVTNFIIFLMFIIYLALFINGFYKLDKFYGFNDIHDSSLYANVLHIIPGMWMALGIFPAFLHFIASIYTGGFDNAEEPYNIYGFVYTIIGFCYIPSFIIAGLVGSGCELDLYILGKYGLIYTFIILTFILCAGLRFNAVTLNIINIVMNSGFVIAWFVIMVTLKGDGASIYALLCSLNLIMCIPQAVLSVLILRRYILVDRFYKGRTKNFLDE